MKFVIRVRALHMYISIIRAIFVEFSEDQVGSRGVAVLNLLDRDSIRVVFMIVNFGHSDCERWNEKRSDWGEAN